MSSHKTLIDGTSRTLSGGGCIINGTNYKISSGNTMINGTSQKVEFGAPKTWCFNQVIDYTSIYTPNDDTQETKTFLTKFYTPNETSYLSNLNVYPPIDRFSELNFEYDARPNEYLTLITYITYDNNTWFSCLEVYRRNGGLWYTDYGNNVRTITFDESPTGDLLYFLQHAATPVY